MDEHQLISLAAQGDDQSIAVLTKQYAPVMLKLQRDYFIKNFDHDDWLQEARLTIYRSAVKYDAQQLGSFGTFYRLLLKHRVVDLIRRSQAYKRQPDRDVLSLDLPTEDVQEALLVTHLQPDVTVHVRQVVAAFPLSCSRFEAQVFDGLLAGFSPEVIARQLAVDLAPVMNAVDRCHRKLKQQLAS
ncbi:DNA-directed RNA polymerase [Lactobacillus sp.] [Lactiplantibacillus mudanjiangensis]|uniref:sigma factor n=1 Tax=Lactiplantibacillus mudanjiangensis TaxID=1296538 RepID=UPI001013F163|nr:sigma factor [Lactiplantibacillus mudanjiangensis]VDG32296.1 DNA-directed RNA polymerase [Lactobacillus sp.] [Lactiplantibacillus mudanjiangensis]